MKKVEIFSIGTELLAGQIANTDAQYLSRKLPELGLSVYYHTVVGDNKERASRCFKEALIRSDIVITTGGLGPTQDDLSKNVIADTLGLKLVMHEDIKQQLKDFFCFRGTHMPDSNYLQAMLPEGCTVLPNDCGTAPGCAIKATLPFGERIVIMLPGPPKELSMMYDRYVVPYLAAESDIKLCSRFVKIAHIGESTVEEMMLSMINGQTNPTYATYCKEGIITVRVSANAKTQQEAECLLDDSLAKMKCIFGDSMYSVTDEEPEDALVRILKYNKQKITCAESCTGGMIASKLTSVSGASEVFGESFVTYSNESKIKLLGVSAETLEHFGAVSAETAREMAIGARKAANADIAISVTGNAGPTAMEDKPVGLVYIGISTNSITETYEIKTSGTREKIRTISSVYAIDYARRVIENQKAQH